MDDQDYSDGNEPDLHGWYTKGIEMGACNMVIAFDIGYPFTPHYVYPKDGKYGVQIMEERLEGGGHIFESIDLLQPLSTELIDRFFRYAV